MNNQKARKIGFSEQGMTEMAMEHSIYTRLGAELNAVEEDKSEKEGHWTVPCGQWSVTEGD